MNDLAGLTVAPKGSEIPPIQVEGYTTQHEPRNISVHLEEPAWILFDEWRKKYDAALPVGRRIRLTFEVVEEGASE